MNNRVKALKRQVCVCARQVCTDGSGTVMCLRGGEDEQQGEGPEATGVCVCARQVCTDGSGTVMCLTGGEDEQQGEGPEATGG